MLSGTSIKPPQLDEFFLDFDLGKRVNRIVAEPRERRS
jgi:hypothetical protein